MAKLLLWGQMPLGRPPAGCSTLAAWAEDLIDRINRMLEPIKCEQHGTERQPDIRMPCCWPCHMVSTACVRGYTVPTSAAHPRECQHTAGTDTGCRVKGILTHTGTQNPIRHMPPCRALAGAGHNQVEQHVPTIQLCQS
jgi:hypothetical protein